VKDKLQDEDISWFPLHKAMELEHLAHDEATETKDEEKP